MNVPSSSSWSFSNPMHAKARKVVADARAFFNKGLKFFELAYKEERDFLGIYSSMETDEERKMVYSMLRYKPAGPRGRTIRYILQCLYNGAAKRNSAAIHNIASDGSQFFDWGSRIRVLFFKFCMYYGLLRHRAVISANEEFEKIYREWETIRLITWGKQNVPITAFQTIWEDKGAKALLAARDNQIWQINIFQTADGPTVGGWDAFDAHPLKVYNDGNVLELRPNRRESMPLLHKVKKKSSYYAKKWGADGETVRWKNLLEWYFTYMMALDMTAIDPETWSRGTSVYGACSNLREKHERFLIAYLPEYRVYTDDLYGPLVFGRLLNPSDTLYGGSVLHVVAYCERLELNKAKKRVDVIDEELTCMQWAINGFHEDENMNVWLSGTKNILTQTITKNPLNQYGPNALTATQKEALRDIYDENGQQIRKDIEEDVREYNELRDAQEKQEAAIIQTEREKEEAQRKLAKLEKELTDLQAQHDNTSKLVNEIKRDAVQSTPGGD